jgi:hypothetical protein
MGYLPANRAKVGEELLLEYFGDHFPIRVEAVGYQPLLDPGNLRARS